LKSNRSAHKEGRNSKKGDAVPELVRPRGETQEFGVLAALPIGLPDSVARKSVEKLNRILADTITLRDLYKKHHWQVTGPAFYQFHLLFDKHYEEQAELVDQIAERIQLLGGISVAMAAHVAQLSRIETPPIGREDVSVQVSRLLQAHELIAKDARAQAKSAGDDDPGTNDLLISNVLRTNELQTRFLAEHLVHTSLRAEAKSAS
jgi:starvation-inducible DNA-binding protein